jgi:hypothetical protein
MTEKDKDIERAKGFLSKARSKKQSRFFCQSGGVFYERKIYRHKSNQEEQVKHNKW